MKIGIFDSGLGGLIIARAVSLFLPEYDYVYFGDTKNLPYGNKSHEEVYEYTRKAIDYLFRKENCAIIIIACNTASSRALRQIQQEYLPANFPDRKVLGVLIPAGEISSKYDRVGVLATLGTIASNTFEVEINKLNPLTKVYQNSAPELVPIIEEGDLSKAEPLLKEYLKPFEDKGLNALVLGCTHYPILKEEIRKLIDPQIKIISQEEIIPQKFKSYLNKHPDLEEKISRGKNMKILVTKSTKNMTDLVKKWFGIHEIEVI
jgi:glutamate racemase